MPLTLGDKRVFWIEGILDRSFMPLTLGDKRVFWIGYFG
jgi:hypothetical protein